MSCHPEVDLDSRAVVKIEQQVFATPANGNDTPVAQPFRSDRRVDSTEHTGKTSDGDSGDFLSENGRFETEPYRFDFRKFWHTRIQTSVRQSFVDRTRDYGGKSRLS